MSKMQHLSPKFIEEVKNQWKSVITSVISDPTEREIEILSIILENCKDENISKEKIIKIYKECQFPYFTGVQPLIDPVGFGFFLIYNNKVLTEINKQKKIDKIFKQLKEYYQTVPYKFPEYVKTNDDIKIYAEQIYNNQYYPTISLNIEKSIVENKSYLLDNITKDSSTEEIAKEIDNIIYEYLYSRKMPEIKIDISKKQEVLDTLLIASNEIATRNKRGLANTIIFNEKYNKDIYLLNEMLKDINNEIEWNMISHQYNNDDIIIGYCNKEMPYDNGILTLPYIFYSENVKKEISNGDIFKIKTKDVKDMTIEEMIENDVKFTDILIIKTRIGLSSFVPSRYFTKIKVK